MIEIEIYPNGECDVTKDRRAYGYDFDDLYDALSVIRNREGRGIEVTVIEADGYRRPMMT